MNSPVSTIKSLISSITLFDDHEKEDIAFAKSWIDSGKELFRFIQKLERV